MMSKFYLMFAVIILAAVVVAQQWLLHRRSIEAWSCIENGHQAQESIDRCIHLLERCEQTIDECPVLQIRGGKAWALGERSTRP